jgi:spectrin alpha
MKGLSGKVSDLEKAAAQRKAKLDENSAFLQFNWKADVVESWIGERAQQAQSFSFSQSHNMCFSVQLVSCFRGETDSDQGA